MKSPPPFSIRVSVLSMILNWKKDKLRRGIQGCYGKGPLIDSRSAKTLVSQETESDMAIACKNQLGESQVKAANHTGTQQEARDVNRPFGVSGTITRKT